MAKPDLKIAWGLRPFDDFERVLSATLKRIAVRKRKRLLRQIYLLAGQKLRMEATKEAVKLQADLFRERRLRMQRTRAHLKNASKALTSAGAAYPKELPRFFDLPAIITQLDKLGEDIRRLERESATVTHPQLRTRDEKDLAQPRPNSDPRFAEGQTPKFDRLFPGMKSRAIDHWFVSSVENCLRQFAVAEKDYFSPAEYDRIISQAFRASFAFGRMLRVAGVKSARRRLQKPPVS